jgi:hypothetical protein
MSREKGADGRALLYLEAPPALFGSIARDIAAMRPPAGPRARG